MSDWAPGDLALCVAGIGHVPGGFGARAPNECSVIKELLAPKPGSKWTVASVELHARQEEDGKELIYLSLQGQPSDIAFDARLFRKIDAHEADAEDAETIEEMTREPAHAGIYPPRARG